MLQRPRLPFEGNPLIKSHALTPVFTTCCKKHKNYTQ